MARRYSDAVVRLARAASTSELTVSPREIERWRQAKVLPAPRRKFPGRGSTSEYPERAVPQAQEIARLLNQGGRLKEVAVPLFFAGYELKEPVVKKAFRAGIDRIEHSIKRRAPAADPLTTSEAAAKTLLRSLRGDPQLDEWRDRVRGREDSTAAILDSVLINVIHILLTGKPVSAEGLDEVYDASGISAMVSSMSLVIGEDVGASEIAILLPKLQLDEYRRLIDEFTLDELIAARSVLEELAAAAPTMVKMVAAAYGFSVPAEINERIAGFVESTVGFGLPLAAWLVRERTEGVAEILAAVRATKPQLEVAAILLERLPPEYHRYLAPGGEAALAAASTDEQAAVQKLTLEAIAADEHLRVLIETVISQAESAELEPAE